MDDFCCPNLKSPREYFRERQVSIQAWTVFGVMVASVALTLLIHIAPGWSWTLEIRGKEMMEGEMYGYYGIWYVCWELVDQTRHTSCSLVAHLDYVPSWFQGCQALMTMVLIAGVLALTLSSAYIYSKPLNRKPMLITAVGVICVLCALFMVIVFVLFSVQFLNEAYWCCGSGLIQIVQWRLWYCFIVACCTPVFYLTAAVGCVSEILMLRRLVREEKYPEYLAASRRYHGMQPMKNMMHDTRQHPIGWRT